MNRKAETFFDDIIKALAIEKESARFANLSHETAVEFYSDNQKKTSPVAPGQMTQSGPISVSSGGLETASSGRPIEIQEEFANYANVTTPASPPPSESAATFDSAEFSNMDIQQLQSFAHQCSLCVLCKGRKNVVFGAGNIHADLMFVGEGPGRDEDIQGIPFVGEAGQLLTKMINAMLFTRSDVYIANIVKCRPPNNRNPEDNEAEICMSYLKRQIELISPKVIVVLGAVPLKYLLGKTGITKRRGLWDSYQGIRVMPTFHPAYLLRNPAAKKQVWEDLQKVMQIFGKTPPAVQQR
jgi:uracil-DNA glycosylase